VSDRDLAAHDEAEIAHHFETITRSPMTVEFERLDQIPRAPSGKLMMAVSEIAARPDPFAMSAGRNRPET
jgi:hypothetical protein